jgi:hypothetical protein
MVRQPIGSFALLFALHVSAACGAPASQDLPQPAPYQEHLLLAARQYASRYMAGLPSFVCTQIVHQFEAGRKPKHWHKGDSLTSQLIWDQGREQRTLELVNNRPVSKHPSWRSPLVSEGEFGNLLDSVLGSSSGATFSWRGWGMIGGKRVGVFEYQVDLRHSSLRLSLGSVQTVIAFHGAVYAEESSGTVWRITNYADGFPAELETKSVARSVDYGEVVIGTGRYVLPVRATVLLDTGRSNIKNELRFDAYRKFDAGSTISYASEDIDKSGTGDSIKR